MSGVEGFEVSVSTTPASRAFRIPKDGRDKHRALGEAVHEAVSVASGSDHDAFLAIMSAAAFLKCPEAKPFKDLLRAFDDWQRGPLASIRFEDVVRVISLSTEPQEDLP